MSDNVDISPIIATGDTEQFIAPAGRIIVVDPDKLMSLGQLQSSDWAGILYTHPPGKRDEILRENFMKFTCPCGVVLKIHPHEFPTKDLMMPCGKPNHYAIKYEEISAPGEGGARIARI